MQGPWGRLLDTTRALDLPVQLPDARGQNRRFASSIQAAAAQLRAERAAAGATQGTLGTLGPSLSATASLSDKLSASQYSLGK